MLIVMKTQAPAEAVRRVCQRIESLGFRPHVMPGAQKTAIGITGNPGPIDGKNLMHRFFLANPGVVSGPKRLWDEAFTNANRSPAMSIPAQITAIRGFRLIQPY